MTGCYAGNPNGARVEIVGDSITFLASARIASTLEPTYSIKVNVVPGITIADNFRRWGAQRPSSRR